MELKKLLNANKLSREKYEKNSFENFERQGVKKHDYMGHHIYKVKPNETYEEHVKHFSWIHYALKGKFIIPTLWIANKYLKKQFDKQIPDVWYNKNLKIFDKAFDDSVFTWYKRFILNLDGVIPEKELPSEEEIKKMMLKHTSSQELLVMKNLMITIIQNDTAYREFFNVLMFEIALGMQKQYGGKGHPHHLLFLEDNICSPKYFMLGKTITGTSTPEKK